jgi:hypothetical protein
MAIDRVTARQKLLHRIVCQSRSVVSVRVSARYPIHPLRNQLGDLSMADSTGISLVRQAARQSVDQPEPPIRCFQQQRSAVRAGLLAPELDHHGLASEIRKHYGLSSGIVGQTKPPLLQHVLYPRRL